MNMVDVLKLVFFGAKTTFMGEDKYHITRSGMWKGALL